MDNAANNASELGKIKQALGGLIDKLLSQKEMNKLGLAGERIILKRTRAGMDVDGRPFKPYTKRYAAKRVELGLVTHPVNLEVDDVEGMLKKIDHVVANDFESVTIDVMDEGKRKLASYHDSLGVAKKGKNIRHFFAFSEKEKEDIVHVVQRDIDSILADLTK